MKVAIRSALSLLSACVIAMAGVSASNACTVLLITDATGHAYKGRTMEFSAQLPSTLVYQPPGLHIQSDAPGGEPGMTFDTRYAILGISTDLVEKARQPGLVEGSNDQGLSFSSNAQLGPKSPTIGTDNAKILSAADLGYWVLGNFKSVEEVKAALSSTDVWLPASPVLGNLPIPLHYAIFDRSGAGIVIEFMGGQKAVYDNPVGVLTNGPEFPWHLTNLNNYTQSNVDQNVGQLGTLKLATPDAGIALTSLPSSQTATGRFVKAAFYANFVRKADTPDGALQMLGHVMNNFDRPYDLTVDTGAGQGDGPRTGGTSTEVTDWTVMSDLSRNLFFVRSINALNWTAIDIGKLKDVKKSKSVKVYDLDKIGPDATDFFRD